MRNKLMNLPDENNSVWLLLFGGNYICAFYSDGHFRATSMGGRIIEYNEIDSWSYGYYPLHSEDKEI